MQTVSSQACSTQTQWGSWALPASPSLRFRVQGSTVRVGEAHRGLRDTTRTLRGQPGSEPRGAWTSHTPVRLGFGGVLFLEREVWTLSLVGTQVPNSGILIMLPKGFIWILGREGGKKDDEEVVHYLVQKKLVKMTKEEVKL